MQICSNGVPRRNRIDLATPVENAVRQARAAVEGAGAHPLLTDASVLIGQALEKVADFVELRTEGTAGPSLGQIGYEAYIKSSGGKSLVSGATLPPWRDLSEAIRNAWESAAESIVGFQMMGSPDAV